VGDVGLVVVAAGAVMWSENMPAIARVEELRASPPISVSMAPTNGGAVASMLGRF
jgi:hypothetical protein